MYYSLILGQIRRFLTLWIVLLTEETFTSFFLKASGKHKRQYSLIVGVYKKFVCLKFLKLI